MCGRFTLTSTPEALAERFGLDSTPSCAPRYNIAPGQDVLAVRAQRGGSRGADLVRWGLVPAWSDPASARASLLINARSETAAQRPAFRDAFRARRCIVPASGFYEWAERGDYRQPYWIAPADRAPLGIAALWERWIAPDGAIARSFGLKVMDAKPGVKDTRGVEIDHAFTERTTFVIAPGGKIDAVFSSEDHRIAPSDHAVESLAAAQKLARTKPR